MTSPDVIVVGGGIIGASIAWRLAQQRVLVTLFDAGEMGGEASTAGAGMLAPGGEITEASRLGELCQQSLKLYPAFVAELCEASGVVIDFNQDGAVEYAASREEWAALSARSDAQQRIGIASEPAEVPVELAHFAGAMRFPNDAAVDPKHVMQALRVACEREGVKIREHVPVTELQSRPGRVDVVTDRRVISAETAVLAAGAWSSFVATVPPVTEPQAEPVRGHLVSFDLPPGRIRGIQRHGHTYLLQRANGELICGTSQERVGFDRTVDASAVADICKRAAMIVPELKGREPSRAWVGFRPGLVNTEGPVLDRLPDSNVFRAYGHYRNGILLAPVSARIVSQTLLAALRAG